MRRLALTLGWTLVALLAVTLAANALVWVETARPRPRDGVPASP